MHTRYAAATNQSSSTLSGSIFKGLALLFILCGTAAGERDGSPPAGSGQNASPPLIAREKFFGNPDRVSPKISPDGQKIAFLAPLEGVLNIWTTPIADLEAARPLTNEKKRGIRSYLWAFTGDQILYSQDRDGDENWNIYCADLETGDIRNLSALPSTDIGGEKGPPVRAEIEAVSHRTPEEILIGLNDRDGRFHDVYRCNLRSGERTLVQKNPGFRGFVFDEDYRPRFASKYTAAGSLVYFQPRPGTEEDTEIVWEEFLTIPSSDTATTQLLGFDATGRRLYMADSRERDTAALMEMDLDSGALKLIAQDPRTDVGAIKSHPTKNTIQAVSFYYDRRERKYLDKEVEQDMQLVSEGTRGDAGIASWSLDDRQWIVAHMPDDGPIRYFHFNRDTKQRKFLFAHRQQLAGLPLAKMQSEIISARDGLKLVSYLTLPLGADADGDGRPDKPLPMVLLVHGGPWARDNWGYEPEHQLLANRGYAVLSVNFRGSTGFGKHFQNIAKRQWSGTMQDDLIDAVSWAVDEKIAQRDKVAIMGGSYGGYATLVGLTFTPEVFACGVDIVGPSSLLTLIESIPPYWESFRQQLVERVGNPDTEQGREELRRRSPLFRASAIQRPLLIGQGKNDPRVKEQEAEQMVQSLQKKQIPVTYVLFPDEGHGFARPENRLAFYAVAEKFLAEHLGGRAEPFGRAFEGSSITVPAGADELPGLREALSAAPSK
jgi:dipeptidyl aminopeptidase/acylaminoacyl peptidase